MQRVDSMLLGTSLSRLGLGFGDLVIDKIFLERTRMDDRITT